MKEKIDPNLSKILLAIHSTNDYFGFAYKILNTKKKTFFIKKLERDLSNNLIFDLQQFLSETSFNLIERISVSLGPANFNASRQIIVCAKALSQQINCSLDSYSSFQIMAKRIAIQNNIFNHNETFWIIKKLKLRGFIAGKYSINSYNNKNQDLYVNELIIPKLYKKIPEDNKHFIAEYKIRDELNELLEISMHNYKNAISNSWKNVLPIYPISPVN